MFDLDKAIDSWRQQLLSAGIKTPVPLEELESHLREDVEEQVRAGAAAQEAFEAASRRIGRAGVLKAEFKKMEYGRPVFQRKILWVLVGIAFLTSWLQFGQSPAIACVYGVLLAALIVATFIDFARFVIPDAITIGGIFLGFCCSLLLPQLHGQKLFLAGMLQSLLGIGVGAGLLYCVLRVGKAAFGKQRLRLANVTRIVFTDKAVLLPDRAIAFSDLFHRESDTILLHASAAELDGNSYRDVPIRMTRNSLRVGTDEFVPKELTRLQVTAGEITLPREAMGMGDVKLMAAIGAFLGWQAVVFSLMVSSLIGSLVACGLIAARRSHWSDRLPYGPYIAAGATIWIFAGKQVLALFVS